MYNSISIVLIALVISLIVYIVVRELNCWYWKINERGEQLDKMNSYLELLAKIEIEKSGNQDKYIDILKNINNPASGVSTIHRAKHISEIKYSDGATYYGEVKEGLPNGKGKMTNVKGEVFEGSYISGIPCGTGIFVDPREGKFEVYIKDGKMTEKKKVN